jgi:hypothetical protein
VTAVTRGAIRDSAVSLLSPTQDYINDLRRRALPDRARAMALALRFTAPSSDDRDWLDYTIVEDGRHDVGRLYEDRHSRPELRWFWSITIYFAPKLGITTNGREASLNEAKAQFLRNWQKCRTAMSSLRSRIAGQKAP